MKTTSAIVVEVKGERITLPKDQYGWYSGHGVAVDPDMKVCQTIPWDADYMSAAPTHEFKVIEQRENL